MGSNARNDTESAVRSVSLLYLDELAGRREQVVSANMQEKINVIHTALDLMTGEASFIKSGAAPSFVVRRGEVHRLEAGTAPIGIIEALDAKATDFPLRIGDTVVLVSDGVLPEDDDGRWLEEMLAECGERTPEEIVYRICLHAASREEHDDCSAVALRICAPEEERY